MKRVLFTFAALLVLFGADAAAQRNRLIADIQGTKNASDYVSEVVRVNGIVTARTRNGFFLQTPDDKADTDPNTSEGIFVFTRTEPGAEATVGNLVSITGRVAEFRPGADQLSLPTTQIVMDRTRDFIAVESKNNALPKPIVLTLDDFKPNTIDQLEKYEGMRVTVPELVVVAPTNGRGDDVNATSESDGVFYAVMKGFARPYREPGYSVYDYVMLTDKEKDRLKKEFPGVPIFDDNPERIRVESSGQLGAAPIDVATFAELKNVTGVVGYAFRSYSILVDPASRPAVSNVLRAQILPVPNERQFSVAAMNIERLFDDADDPATQEPIVTPAGLELRLKKMSAAIRVYLHSPDIIGISEAENLASLKRLAERVNKDAEAAGKPNPQYEAYLVEGNDIGGIDSGFLVKRSRVDVLETVQFGKDLKYRNPNTKEDNWVNDRPPFLLRAAIKDPKLAAPYELTVIVNHLKSFRGYNDEKDAPAVRMKKKLQAEFLAKFLNDRQKANPNERIALVGDFNFYQFNDGIMDVIGTIKGTPTMPGFDDLVNPDLINLVDLIKQEQRYSYVFSGNAQVLDHFLVNEVLRKSISGFGFARINADFPEVLRNDPNRVERFSDHDPAVAYFTLY